jgi:hypothetical protein
MWCLNLRKLINVVLETLYTLILTSYYCCLHLQKVSTMCSTFTVVYHCYARNIARISSELIWNSICAYACVTWPIIWVIFCVDGQQDKFWKMSTWKWNTGIVERDGLIGLYRGFVPNALKSLPNSRSCPISLSLSFYLASNTSLHMFFLSYLIYLLIFNSIKLTCFDVVKGLIATGEKELEQMAQENQQKVVWVFMIENYFI